jgi:hypothetical protein
MVGGKILINGSKEIGSVGVDWIHVDQGIVH